MSFLSQGKSPVGSLQDTKTNGIQKIKREATTWLPQTPDSVWLGFVVPFAGRSRSLRLQGERSSATIAEHRLSLQPPQRHRHSISTTHSPLPCSARAAPPWRSRCPCRPRETLPLVLK